MAYSVTEGVCYAIWLCFFFVIDYLYTLGIVQVHRGFVCRGTLARRYARISILTGSVCVLRWCMVGW